MKWVHLFGLTVWIVSVFTLLKIIETTKLQPFDPQQMLLMHSMDNQFESDFTEALFTFSGELSNTAVHFRTGGCICEALVQSHSDELASSLSTLGYKNLTLNVNDLPNIASHLPSTPAVAIFNKSQQLVYLGPYSIGLGCFTDDSLINTITRYTLAKYLGPQINSETQGCYCAT